MNRLEFALHVAENTGFTKEQIDGIKPVMQLILDKAEDKIESLEEALACCKDNKKQVYDIARFVGTEDDLGMLAISLLLTAKSHDIFMDKKIPEKVFMDTMKNIRVWTNTYAWNHEGKLGMDIYEFIHYNLWGLFLRHGRFEYVPAGFDYDQFEISGRVIKRGEPVLDVHIPADGPMNPEDMEESFRLAYQYYQYGETTPFVCSSWLLYPGNRKFCKPDSNMVKFLECFHILTYEDDPRCSDLGRVFGDKASHDNYEALPEDTSLQRSLKTYLLNGGTMGGGYGVFLHDGKSRL